MISGMDCLMAATISTIYAFIVASITDKLKFEELVDCAVDNVKHLNLVFFILMLAYAMAEAFMATGVGAAIVNIALSLGVTGRTVALVSFLATCVLSVATGTSWGTFAACAPIFLWLNHMVDGNILLTTASIAGGACFGDNIGLISDTTVVSSGIHDVQVVDRVKSQGPWSLVCLVASIIIIYLIGVKMGLPTDAASATSAVDKIPVEVMKNLEVQRPSAVELLNQVKNGVPYYMAIPLILVLAVAFKGLPTLACLNRYNIIMYLRIFRRYSSINKWILGFDDVWIRRGGFLGYSNDDVDWCIWWNNV